MDPIKRNHRLVIVLIAEIVIAAIFILMYARGCINADAATHDSQTVLPKLTAASPALLFGANELPGRYYFGDGLGVNCSLVIESDHRFSFTWSGCMGVYDQNHGSWQLKGDVLVCKPEKKNRRDGFEGMNTRFIPVKWGKLIYLVDENEMPGFAASASSQKSSTKFELWTVRGRDYVKQDGKTLPTIDGKPLVPDRYRTFLDNGAIRGRVDRILPSGLLVLNNGRRGGLAPGMLLAINEFKNLDAKVVSTTTNEAVCKPVYVWNSGRTARPGDEFTTGSGWQRPHGTGYEQLSKLPAPKSPDKK